MNFINKISIILIISSFQYSHEILISHDEFEGACRSFNSLIGIGLSPSDAIFKISKFLFPNRQLLRNSKKGKNTPIIESSAQKDPGLPSSVTQSASGKFANFLHAAFTEFVKVVGTQVQLTNTTGSKVNVFGKREVGFQIQLPCSLMPFPSEVEIDNQQSVESSLFTINHFLKNYFGNRN